MDRGTEEVVRELRSLAGKKPLANEGLQRSKQLMIALRKMGFTNAEVSELTEGGWSEATVKLYTRGAKVDNPGPKKQASDLIIEIVKRNLTLDDVTRALSVVSDIEAKGVKLDRFLGFLDDIERSKTDLKDLLGAYDKFRRSKLTVELLNETLSFLKELKALGVTMEDLKAIPQAAKQYGDADGVLKAIAKYGELKSFEASIAQLEQDKANRQKTVDDLVKTVESLKDQEKKIKDNLNLCRGFEAEGLTLNLLKELKLTFDRYGGIMEFLESIKAYSNLVELQNETSKLETKKIDIETKIKNVEADHAHLKHVIETCDTLLYTYGFNVSAIETLHKVSKTYGGAINVLEAVGKYAQLTDIENEVNKATVAKNKLDASVKELEKQAESMRGVAKELQRSGTKMLSSLSTKMTEVINHLEESFTKAMTDTSSSFKSSQENLAKTYSDTLTVIEQKLPETLHTLGQIDEKIRRSKDLAVILDLVEKPAEVKEQTSKVMASALAYVTGLQAYVNLNKEEISNYTLGDALNKVHDQLIEIVRIELGKTKTGS
jgi:hypothetical protein